MFLLFASSEPQEFFGKSAFAGRLTSSPSRRQGLHLRHPLQGSHAACCLTLVATSHALACQSKVLKNKQGEYAASAKGECLQGSPMTLLLWVQLSDFLRLQPERPDGACMCYVAAPSCAAKHSCWEGF